ncbi:MAG TPA: tetratricopeptide repeat protein, partial [Chloroflexota bacterium]|nr:tetratricopeptide repeat protein [Chloroflexota bacterium]
DKSLVVAELSEQGVARYRLLETLRQFGWEKLEAAREAESLGERHARYYLAQAEEGERGLRGRDQVDWLWRLEADHDNLRAGLTWLESRGQVDPALRLAGALAVFWAIRGYYAEGRARLERLLARPEAAESWAERGKALWGLGRLADRQGDFGVVRTYFEESRACAARAGDRETIIRALIGLGKWAVNQDDRRADQWLAEALARARELGEPWAIAAVLGEKAQLEAAQGDLVLAQSLSEERLALARQMGDTWEVNFALHTLGQFALNRGDDARARALFDEKLAIARALGDRSSIATTLCFLGQVDAAQGAPEPARVRFEEGIAIYRDRGDQDGIAFAACNLCELALSRGDLGAARAFAAECLTAARIPGAEKLVTALLCSGDVALAGGDGSAAEGYLAEALALLGPAGRPGPTAQILQGFARVAATRNQPARALRLAGRAATLRGWNAYRLASIDLALLERALRPLRDAPGGLSPDEQAAAWAEGEAMATEQAVADALSREE